MNEDLFSPNEQSEAFESPFESSDSLADLNQDPGSFLEKFLDYTDAEAIHTFFSSLVENLVSAFKGSFQDYLDAVETGSETLSEELSEPLQDFPVMKGSRAAELIEQEIKIDPAFTEAAADRLVPSADAGASPKLEHTVLTDHTVAGGDMLSSLALQYYGRAELWPLIHEANRETIGDNPGRIYPGQVLHIPTLDGSESAEKLVLSHDTPPLVFTAAPVEKINAQIQAAAEAGGTFPPEAGQPSAQAALDKLSPADGRTGTAAPIPDGLPVFTNQDSGGAIHDPALAESVQELAGSPIGDTAEVPAVYGLSWLGPLVAGVVYSTAYSAGGFKGPITQTTVTSDSGSSTAATDAETDPPPLPAVASQMIEIAASGNDAPAHAAPAVGDIEPPPWPTSALPLEDIFKQEEQHAGGTSNYSGYDTRPEIPPPDEIREDGTKVWHEGSRPDYSGGDMLIEPDGTISIEF